MLISFSTNSFPDEYVSFGDFWNLTHSLLQVPTVFDNYDTTHVSNGVLYNISLIDTGTYFSALDFLIFLKRAKKIMRKFGAFEVHFVPFDYLLFLYQ